MADLSVRREGTCPVCFALKKLRRDGMMHRHGSGKKNVWPPEDCTGRGEPPVESQSTND